MNAPHGLYHVVTELLEFDVYGRLEKASGVYVLRLRCVAEYAFAIERQLKAKDAKPIEIFSVNGDALTLPARAHKCKLIADGAAFDVALMLLA